MTSRALRQSPVRGDALFAAYADFWRKAGEDYGNEITTMTRLMTDMTSKAILAAQSATEEASTRLTRREERDELPPRPSKLVPSQ
jgi:hypothetical protein